MSNLYRFFSFKLHNIDSIANKYLYFSNLSDFNDPFEDIYVAKENLPKPDDIDDGTLIKLHQKMNKHYKKASVYTNQEFTTMILNKVSLTPFKKTLISLISNSIDEQYKLLITNKKHCCFIQDNSVKKALNNKLMWSHYADGMRGFCIEFHKDKLIQHLDTIENNHINSGDMSYSDLSKISIISSFEEYLDDPQSKNLSGVLTAKSPEWEYENEFRISSLEQKVNFKIDCIKSITIGYKMPQEQRNTLFTILKGIGVNGSININEAIINKKTYNIDVIECVSFNEANDPV